MSAVMNTIRSDDVRLVNVSAINTRIKLAAEAARLKAEFAMLQKRQSPEAEKQALRQKREQLEVKVSHSHGSI